MKLIQLSVLGAILGILFLGSCDDPAPSGPQTYDGTNGAIVDKITFVLPDNSVKTYENLRMDFNVASFGFVDAARIQRAVSLADFRLERREVTLKLALPSNANKPGEYVWVDGTIPTTTEAYTLMDRDDVPFTSVRGKTIITKFGAPGEKVEGTFSGTIRNQEDGVESNINGKFSAVRIN